jgi:hypothetical protein
MLPNIVVYRDELQYDNMHTLLTKAIANHFLRYFRGFAIGRN